MEESFISFWHSASGCLVWEIEIGFEDTDAFEQVPDKYLNRLFSCATTLENFFHTLSLNFLVYKIEMDIITKFLARIK